MRYMLLTLGIAVLVAVACSTSAPPPEVTVIDYRNTRGALVLAYSPDEEFRRAFEDRLVGDLADRELTAFASYPDIPDIQASSRDQVLSLAHAKKAMFVLVVEEVRHSETGIVSGENRITHDHPTLRDFYRHSMPEEHQHEDDDQVFVEVSAFLIQEDAARLFWSGTTWSLQADGQGDRIGDFSNTIADAIKSAVRRRQMGFE